MATIWTLINDKANPDTVTGDAGDGALELRTIKEAMEGSFPNMVSDATALVNSTGPEIDQGVADATTAKAHADITGANPHAVAPDDLTGQTATASEVNAAAVHAVIPGNAHLMSASQLTDQTANGNAVDTAVSHSTTTTGNPHQLDLNDLDDASAGSPSSGDLLRWNGSAWVNYPDSNYTSITTGSHAPSSGDYVGFSVVPASLTFEWQKIGDRVEVSVVGTPAGCRGTQAIQSFIINNIPIALRPTSSLLASSVGVGDEQTNSIGVFIYMDNLGTWSITKADGTLWAGSGQCGLIPGTTFTYRID